jgi:hypothetical protein
MLQWSFGIFELVGWIVLNSLRRCLLLSLTYIEKTINMPMVLRILVFIFLDLNDGTRFRLLLVMSLLEIRLAFLNIDFVNLFWSIASFFPSPSFSLKILRIKFLMKQLYFLKLPLEFWSSDSSPPEFFVFAFIFNHIQEI